MTSQVVSTSNSHKSGTSRFKISATPPPTAVAFTCRMDFPLRRCAKRYNSSSVSFPTILRYSSSCGIGYFLKSFLDKAYNPGAQSLQGLGVGIQACHFLGQRFLTQLCLKPVRKIIDSQRRSQSRFKNMKIKTGNAYLLQPV